MHAVVRSYSGESAKKLFDLLEQKKGEVELAMGKVKGFSGYTLLRTGDGGVSVTVCNDKAGTDDSLAVARDWIKANASQLSVAAPTVMEGQVILQLK